MSQHATDQQLITAILQGNSRMYGVLVERYQALVFTIALRYTRQREDAEELAQAAFVKAYTSLAQYRGDARFSTWLYTIVSSLGLSWVRRKQLDTLSLSHEKVQAVADGLGQMEANRAEVRSRTDMLHRAIDMLLPDDAQVLTLFYLAEQSLEEVAQVMQIEANTAKVKLHRARGRLRKVIEQHFAGSLHHL